jgi:hypothetical protein
MVSEEAGIAQTTSEEKENISFSQRIVISSVRPPHQNEREIPLIFSFPTESNKMLLGVKLRAESDDCAETPFPEQNHKHNLKSCRIQTGHGLSDLSDFHRSKTLRRFLMHAYQTPISRKHRSVENAQIIVNDQRQHFHHKLITGTEQTTMFLSHLSSWRSHGNGS